jgi:asparagine synthase (glutamine-hydrolysing)
LSGEGGDELFGGYHLLKSLPGASSRLKMMQHLIEIAYNTALQRLDRAMFGHSINYRTPFLDSHLTALALQIPVAWKIRETSEGKLLEKHILREAFRDLLPEQIYARPKLRFSAGTGTDGLLDKIAREAGKEEGFNIESASTRAGFPLQSPKEAWYYEIFKSDFPDAFFETMVGRWDPDKR